VSTKIEPVYKNRSLASSIRSNDDTSIEVVPWLTVHIKKVFVPELQNAPALPQTC